MGPIKRFNQERYETQHLNGLKAGTGFRTTANRKGGAPSSLTRDVWNARGGTGARMYGLWHQAQRKGDCEARVWAWDGDRHCAETTSLGGGGGWCVGVKDREDLRAAVRGLAKSGTLLTDWTYRAYITYRALTSLTGQRLGICGVSVSVFFPR